MIAAIAGLILGIFIIVVTKALQKYFSPSLIVSGCLIAIAFIYVGFSLKGNQPINIILESLMALFFYFMALYGYTKNSKLPAVGIILHGVWDFCHHNNWIVDTIIPPYWPSFCFVIDLVDGIYFYFLLRNTSLTPRSFQARGGNR